MIQTLQIHKNTNILSVVEKQPQNKEPKIGASHWQHEISSDLHCFFNDSLLLGRVVLPLLEVVHHPTQQGHSKPCADPASSQDKNNQSDQCPETQVYFGLLHQNPNCILMGLLTVDSPLGTPLQHETTHDTSTVNQSLVPQSTFRLPVSSSSFQDLQPEHQKPFCQGNYVS